MTAQNQSSPMMRENCPQCGLQNTTFDVIGQTVVPRQTDVFDVFACCRGCHLASTARVYNRANSNFPSALTGRFISEWFDFRNWVVYTPKTRKCPDFVPPEIERIFHDAAACEALALWDASGVMYRKVLDAATRTKTPVPEEGNDDRPKWKVYKDLRLRLDWLFERKLIDPSLQDLSSCVHQDGNDAAHDVVGIGKSEAQDLGDFVELCLKTLFTVPGQIAENIARREVRRTSGGA